MSTIETARERRTRCEGERVRAMKAIEHAGEMYCVELAAQMGWTMSKAVAVLRRLWLDGALERVKRPSPTSGQGRLYYRLPRTEPDETEPDDESDD